MSDRAGLERPIALFTMSDETMAEFLSPNDVARLNEIVALEKLDFAGKTLVALKQYQDLLQQVEILITGWTTGEITDDILDLMPNLKLIAHSAGTVKQLLPGSTWSRGITVTSCAKTNAVPVAEFTLAAILFSNKRVLQLAHAYKTDRTERSKLIAAYPDIGNTGKTIGLVGGSTIGKLVAELLRPFDLDVLMYDPVLSEAETRHLGVRRVDMTELLTISDIVSLHAPLLESTIGMIGKKELAQMRDGCTLINTGRGELTDHWALEAELKSGRINAVIDTTSPEPLPKDSAYYDLPNVLLTPHIAGSCGAELKLLGRALVKDIEAFTNGREAVGSVQYNHLHYIA